MHDVAVKVGQAVADYELEVVKASSLFFFFLFGFLFVCFQNANLGEVIVGVTDCN